MKHKGETNTKWFMKSQFKFANEVVTTIYYDTSLELLVCYYHSKRLSMIMNQYDKTTK